MPPLSEADKQKKLLAARKKLRNFQEKRTGQHGSSTPRATPGPAVPSNESTIAQPLPSPVPPSPAALTEPDDLTDPAAILEQARAELDATQRNYDRVKTDLDDAVAKRFQSAQEDKERINRLTQEKQAVESRNRDLLHEIAQLQARLSRQPPAPAARLVSESDDALEKAHQDLAELRSQLDARDAELTNAQMACHNTQVQADCLRNRFQNLEREIEATTKQQATERDGWEQSLVNLRSDHDQSEAKWASELQARDELVTTLQAQLKATQQDLKSMHTTTTEQASEQESLRFELHMAQTKLARAQEAADCQTGKLSTLQTELQAAHGELKTARTDMDQQEYDICALRDKLQAALDNLKLVKTTAGQREGDLITLQSELQAARNELQVSQTAVEQREKDLDGLQTECNLAKQQAAQLQKDLCAANERVQQAAAQAAIADKAHSHLKADLERAQADAQQLTATNHALEAKVATVTSQSSQLESTIAALHKAEASLRDELAANANRMQQSESARETIIAQHRTELATLQAQHDAKAGAKAMQWKYDTATYKERIHQLEAQCDTLNAKCQQFTVANTKLEQQVTAAAALQETDQRRIQELLATIQTLHDRIATQETSLSQAHQGIETERHAKIELEGKYQEQCANATKHKALMALLSDQIAALANTKATLTAQVQQAHQDHGIALDQACQWHNRVRQELASLATQHIGVQKLLTEREVTIQELEQTLETARSRVCSAECQVQSLQRSLVSLQDNHERAMAHILGGVVRLEKQSAEHQARFNALQVRCDDAKRQWQTAEVTWKSERMQLQACISEQEQQTESLTEQLVQSHTARDDVHRKYVDLTREMDALHTTLGETRRTVNQMREAHQALEDKQARTSREHGQERVQWQAQVTDLQAKLDSWSTLQQSWQTESEELKCHVAQLTAQRTHLQSAYGTVLQYHTALVSEVKSMRAATVHTLDQYCQQLVKLNATASACRIASRHLLQSHSNAHCTWEHEKLGLLTQLATIETQLTRATETYAQQRQNHADELTTAQEQLANRDRAHTTLQSKFSQQAAATARLRCTLDQAVMELGHERQLLSANIAEHQRTHRAQIDQLQLLRRILIAQAESQQAQHAESRQQYCALQQRYDKALEDKARAEQEFRIRLESMEQDCTKSVATANHTVALLRAQRATQLNLYQQSHAKWEQAVTGLRADVCNSKAQHQCEMRNFANAMAKIRQQAAQALQIVAYNYQTWTDQSLQWRDAEAHWDQRLRATEEAKATLTVELARVEASNDHALTTMRQAWQAEASQFTATRHQDHQRLETLAQSLASQKLRWQTHTTAMAAAFHQICSDLAQARAMQMSELSSFSTQYNQLQTLGRELRSNTATALTHCQDQASALAARLESTLSLSQARALTLYDNLTTQAMRIETALKHLPGTAAVATTPPRTAALSSPSTGSPRPSASVRALEKKNIALAAKFTNAQRQWQAQERQLLARLEALQTDATKLGTRLATQQSKSENATLNHALATKERELAALEAKWEHRSEIWEAEAQDLRSRVAQAESDAKATNNDRDLVDASRRPLIALKIKNAQLAAQLKVAHDKLDQFRGSVAHTAQAVSKPPTSPDSPSPSTPSSSSVLKKKALLQKARQISAQRAAKKLLGA